MATRIVIMTNTSWEARTLVERFVASGLAPVLIVCQEHNDAPVYSWPSRMARGIVGDRVMDRLARLRLPADVIETIAWERTLYLQSQEWLRTASGSKVSHDWPTGIPRIVSERINEEHIATKIEQARPDVIVIHGTGMIKQRILDIPKRGCINAHSSLLPHYKGPRSEFWQCYNDDRRYVGVSFHMAVAKADAGDILHQVPTAGTWPSDPFTLRAANTLAVLQNYPRVVREYMDGALIPRPQGKTTTPVYRLRDVTMPLRVALKKRISGE